MKEKVRLVRSEINARLDKGEKKKDIAASFGISTITLRRFLDSKKRVATIQPRTSQKAAQKAVQIQTLNASLQGNLAPALLPAVKKLVRAMQLAGADAFEIDLHAETFSVRGTQTFQIPLPDEDE